MIREGAPLRQHGRHLEIYTDDQQEQLFLQKNLGFISSPCAPIPIVPAALARTAHTYRTFCASCANGLRSSCALACQRYGRGRGMARGTISSSARAHLRPPSRTRRRPKSRTCWSGGRQPCMSCLKPMPTSFYHPRWPRSAQNLPARTRRARGEAGCFISATIASFSAQQAVSELQL